MKPEPLPALRPLLWPVIAAMLLGCTPTLDWRQIPADGSGIQALFPCRPDRHERNVRLAASPAQMQMLVCAAGGATYGLSFFDVAEPAQVGASLAELRRAAATNPGDAQPRQLAPVTVPGATPNPESGKLTLQGRLPDGAAVQEQAVFFAKGLRVYQATVIGARLSADAVEPFFSGLKLPA